MPEKSTVLSFQLDEDALALLDEEAANYNGMSRNQVARLLLLRVLNDQTAYETRTELFVVRNELERQTARMQSLEETNEKLKESVIDLSEATGEILDRLDQIAQPR